MASSNRLPDEYDETIRSDRGSEHHQPARRLPDEYDQTILSFAAGELLSNRYRLVRELGRGGMGVVWLAEDTTLDDRKVALKLLPSVLCRDKRAISRLKAEAIRNFDLTHPYITRLINFEVDDNHGGMAYLVMQYIEGQTLNDLLADHPDGLPLKRIIRWATQIARAIDYAHLHDVLHRDIKPSNMMIGNNGDAYLMDFGIAREAKDTMTRVTGRDSSGTLPYMSPQQVDGQNHKSNDIYSFAATIYEALKGYPPFTTGDIYQQIKHIEVSPIQGLPDHVNQALLQGLAKHREDRPRNARMLVAQLKNAMPPAPTSVHKMPKIVQNEMLEETESRNKRNNWKYSLGTNEVGLRQSINYDVREYQREVKKGNFDYINQIYETRLEDWKKAANLGWPEGQWLLGLCYDEGLGVPKQQSTAAHWFLTAADQGDAVAQYLVGWCYDSGSGVSQDTSEAIRWWNKAAKQGNTAAQIALENCYSDGDGVSQDQ